MQNGPLIVLFLVALMTIVVFLVVAGGAIYTVFKQRVHIPTDLELAGRQDRLESKLKQLHDEWESTRSNLDTIIRRGIRLKVLESRKEPDVPGLEPGRPLTRADLLKRALANQGMRPKPKEEQTG